MRTVNKKALIHRLCVFSLYVYVMMRVYPTSKHKNKKKKQGVLKTMRFLQFHLLYATFCMPAYIILCFLFFITGSVC